MKTKVLFLTAMLASAGVFAVDASAQSNAQSNSYAYGMKLDVAEVISVKEVPHGRCEPVDATMTYRDSKGQTHTVSYTKQDNDCY